MAASGLDPTFGAGGLVLGTPLSSPPLIFDYQNTSSVTAIAVQRDGKIVTAETNAPTASSTPTAPISSPVVIHRYNANGSVDTTFGTGGQTVLPFGTGNYVTTTAPSVLAITTSGQILVAAAAATQGGLGPVPPAVSELVRLTADGQLDPTFGTSGVATLPSTLTLNGKVAVTTSGRVLVAGTVAANTGINTSDVPELAVAGLTSTGSIDLTYGTNGVLGVPNASASILGQGAGSNIGIVGFSPTPDGHFLLGTIATPPPPVGTGNGLPTSYEFTLTRLDAAGAIDTSFGTGGTLEPFQANEVNTAAFAVQPDGRIVVAGSRPGPQPATPDVINLRLAQLTATGAADPTFQPTNTTVPVNSITSQVSSVAVTTDGAITVLQNDGVLRRFRANGTVDATFGRAGQAQVVFPTSAAPAGTTSTDLDARVIAATPSGRLLIGASAYGFNRDASFTFYRSVLAQVIPTAFNPVINDYDGDGKSDLAAQLSTFAAFAIRPSTGSGDLVQPFGIPGTAQQTIPAPGDYDGDGKADVAAFLPEYGVLAYRPSTGGADRYIRFGATGLGSAIPVPGDYDGDGKTDVALFAPGNLFVIDPSSGAAPYAFRLGNVDAVGAIPAPGDYDGDGKTDLAIYLPILGAFEYHPSSTGPNSTDVYVPFGDPDSGATLPAPGDYDGDGKTDLAAYLPKYGVFAYRASSGTGDVLTPFGPPGLGNAFPVPGDYDGDGKTDIALYLPNSAAYAIVPSAGGAPYAQPFGFPGANNTVPATAVVEYQIPQLSAQGFSANAASGLGGLVPVYQPDALDGLTPPARKKPRV